MIASKRRQLLAAVAFAVGLADLSASTPSGRTSSDRSLNAILEKTARYVRHFEETFAVVISDETYTQHVQVLAAPIAPGVINQDTLSPPVTSRTLRSEMLFMWIPEDRRWLSIRNVLAVDGKSVADTTIGLEMTLKAPLGERESRLRHLAEYSARFNIGSIHRNFNNPTLALQFLDPSYQSRFTFTIKELDAGRGIDGAVVRRIAFAEAQRPTVIQDEGKDLFATGSLWIREQDSTVVRTNLMLAGHKTTPNTSIVVDYTPDPRLEMWVPLRMEEHYRVLVIGENTGSMFRTVTRFNEIDGVATYSNFRRFETSGRIVTPK